MTGEKLTTDERLLLGGLGVASAIIDVFTFGFGTGLIQGGKFVGKEVAKGMMKQVGKYAVIDMTTSVALGWTSNYASEKLRDMGLSSEEIFMVHLVASLSVMGYSKYKKNKVNINASDKETVEIITDIKGIDEASDIAKNTSKAAKSLDEIDDIGDVIKRVSNPSYENVSPYSTSKWSEYLNNKYGAENVSYKPKNFTSTDPLVGELATSIDTKFPGKVQDVNVIRRDQITGRVLTDFDIELDNAIIQVKVGGGKGMVSQLEESAKLTNKTVIGYGPDLKGSIIKGGNKSGFNVFRSEEELIQYLKTLK